MQQLRFGCLGGVRIGRDTVPLPLPSPQRTAFLAYLLTQGDRMHARAVLAGLFWGEKSDKLALHNVSDVLHHLRNELDAIGPT